MRLGASMGEAVAVLSALQPDERVVTDGSFFLRAEATRRPWQLVTMARPGGLRAPQAIGTSWGDALSAGTLAS